MKPPKVSRAVLRSMNAGVMRAYARDVEVPRRPTGLGVNALPDYWLERRPDGSFWFMQRVREGAEDRCLAVIAADVIRAAQASRVPLVLEAK